MRHLATLAVASFALMGCRSGPMPELMRAEGYVVKPTGTLRGRTVDIEASQVVATDREGPDPAAVRMEIRKSVGEGIQAALGDPGPASKRKPIRFRVRDLAQSSIPAMTFLPCAIVLVAFGCPPATKWTYIYLDVEVDGKIYTATGFYSAVVTLYAKSPEGARAYTFLPEALKEALQKIENKVAASATVAGAASIEEAL